MGPRPAPLGTSLGLGLAVAAAGCQVGLDGVIVEPVPAEFPGAARWLRGLGPAVADGAWRVGDEALFGLRLQHDGGVQRWLLHLELLEVDASTDAAAGEVAAGATRGGTGWTVSINGTPQTFVSRRCRVAVSVADQAGNLLGRSTPALPRDLLARGLAAACEAAVRRQQAAPHTVGTDRFYVPGVMQPLADAAVATIALLQLVQDDEVLAPLLWAVVERPSLWSMVRHGGARVVLQPGFQATARVPTPVAAAGPLAWTVPMTLLVNDAPVLRLDLTVAPAATPYALAAGVLGITARHPSVAGREVSLVVLATRRGPVP